MKAKRLTTRKALEIVVDDWIQRIEPIRKRCISTLHEAGDGEQIITIYDTQDDMCLTVWISPSRFGNEVLEQARMALSLPDITKGGQS